MNNKNIEEGSYQLDKIKDLPSKIKEKILYTLFGQHQKTLDGFPILIKGDPDKDEAIFAFKETKDTITNFFIKTDDNGTLFNPMEISPSSIHKKIKLLGGSKIKQFTKVSEECFNLYITFLKTRNTLHLKFAEQKKDSK